MGQPWSLFCSWAFFSNIFYKKTVVGFSGIQTQIVTVKGKHADNKTTTTALLPTHFSLLNNHFITCCYDKTWTIYSKFVYDISLD